MNPLTIVKRAFNSKVKDMAVSPEEKAELEAAGVSDPTIQRYLLWRKASIVMVIVATVLSAAVSTYSTYMEDEDAPDVVETLKEGALKNFGIAVPDDLKARATEAAAAAAPALDAAKEAAAGATEAKKEKEDEEADEKKEEEMAEPLAGKVVDAMHTLSIYAMPIAAVIVLLLRNRFRLAYRVLIGAFLFSFFAPMLVELLPWSLWEKPEPPSPTDAVHDLLEAAQVLAALLPAVLSLIPGVQKACLRVKALLPQSLLPGWFVVIASALYGLFLFVIFVAIDQVIENLAVLLPIALLALASLFYAFRAGVITRPLLAEVDFRRMKTLQLTVLGITLIAGITLLVSLLGADFFGVHVVGTDPKKSLMSPIDVVSFALEIIGRSMFVGVVGAELMMRLNLLSWTQSRAVAASDAREPYDGAMEQMQTVANG